MLPGAAWLIATLFVIAISADVKYDREKQRIFFRFHGADGYAVTGEGGVLGYNMFAYCNNDPVNKSDTDGSRPVEVDEDPNRRLVATIKPRAPKKTIEESRLSSSKTDYGATIAFGKSLSVNTGVWILDLQAGLAIDME